MATFATWLIRHIYFNNIFIVNIKIIAPRIFYVSKKDCEIEDIVSHFFMQQ